MDLGRPENVELLFRRGQRLGRPTIPPPGGGIKTKIDPYCDLVTLNVFYKNSRLKQYLNHKDGVALRIETVINALGDLGCNRQLGNLPELQAKARAINARLLHTEIVGQGTAPGSGQRRRRHAVHGHRHHQQSLRALMTGLLHRPYSMNQASYDLSRLARNGLIRRIPGRNRYTLTRDGLLFAHF